MAEQIGHLVAANDWRDRWLQVDQPTKGGGQADTFKAHRASDGIYACIKRLRNNTDPDRRARFVREANILALVAHERVPRLIETNASRDDACTAKNAKKLYLAVEFIEGPTLTEYIAERGPVNPRPAIEMCLMLLDVLASLHPEFIHRDIKPENVILRNGLLSDPVLVDFGISAWINNPGDFRTPLEQELGNRFLRLPEVAPGVEAKADTCTDLTHVLGLAIFAMSGTRPSVLIDGQGRLPHQRPEVRERLLKAPDINRDILFAVFDRGFQPEVARRYLTAASLSDALTEVIHEREQLGDANAVLRHIAAQFADVPLAQAKEYKRSTDAVLQWVRGIKDSFRGRLPPNIDPTEMAGRCAIHRSGRIACNQYGFSVHSPKQGHVLPHFVSEVIGDEVVLRGVYDGQETALARTSLDVSLSLEQYRQCLELYFVDCLAKYLENK